jgi:hypothetical protein
MSELYILMYSTVSTIAATIAQNLVQVLLYLTIAAQRESRHWLPAVDGTCRLSMQKSDISHFETP